MSRSCKNGKELRERDLQIFHQWHDLGKTSTEIVKDYDLSLIRVQQILQQERKRHYINKTPIRSLPILVDRLNKLYENMIYGYCHQNLSIDGIIKRVVGNLYFINNEQGAKDLIAWLRGTTFENLCTIKGLGRTKINILIKIRDDLRSQRINADDLLIGIQHIYS